MADSLILAKPYNNSFRTARVQLFSEVVSGVLKKKNRVRIIDLGGREEFWRAYAHLLPQGNIEITMLNLGLTGIETERFKFINGDARSVDSADNSFDIVFSNSTIEHVGRWQDLERMAGEVRRLAPVYFVQTPYFWFPYEPHCRTLFFHWLPQQWRYRIVMLKKCGNWEKQSTVAGAMRAIESNMMIDKKQMISLFPDASIIMERAFLLPKSILAVRGP